VKLHDLHPAPGSRRDRTRVGRGIAAGKGKTAGRGTKGQKARAGASIPAWFEGGQTPIHIRVPKLRGFKNRFKIEYSVVNVGEISAYAAAGRFGVELEPGAKAAKGGSPVTVNAEVLASAGLIGSTERPLKVLGQGEVGEKLFVAADAFSASARRKIEEAGGFVQLLAPEKETKTSDASADASTELEQAAGSQPTAASAQSAQSAQSADEGETPSEPEASTADAKPARKRGAKQQDAAEA
jgi:large subunit ribosomal protein L15